jgi:hypothetical protein
VYLLRHLFTAGDPPPAPFPDCGYEEVETGMTCGSFPRCQGK